MNFSESDGEISSQVSSAGSSFSSENFGRRRKAGAKSGSAAGSSTLDEEGSASRSDFSDDVELVIGESGHQSIDQPLVDSREVYTDASSLKRKPQEAVFLLEEGDAKKETLLIEDGKVKRSSVSPLSFLNLVTQIPDRLHNVAVIGAIHHGKTSLVKNFISTDSSKVGQIGVTEEDILCSKDEKDRATTSRSHVISTLKSGEKIELSSHLLTFIDTPGHPDFIADTSAALRLADAALLCVDAAEGPSSHTERLIRQAILSESIPIILVVTKLDRLIMDLKLPPLDAYRKLRAIIDAVNNTIASCGSVGKDFLVAPENGSVCFSSSHLGFYFSLETFAYKYKEAYPSLNPCALTPKLWGQMCFEDGKFTPIRNMRQRPSFVTFILEPLYKVIAHSSTGKGHDLLSTSLRPLPRGPLEAIREAVKHYCGSSAREAMDHLLGILPNPLRRSDWLYNRYRENEKQERLFSTRGTAEDTSEQTVAVATLLQTSRNNEVAAIVRVLKGNLRRKSGVFVVDEHSNDSEPFYTAEIGSIWVRLREGFVEVPMGREGQIVYVFGLGKRPGGHLLLLGNNEHGNENEEQGDQSSYGAASGLAAARIFPLPCDPPLIHISLELKDPMKASLLQDGLQSVLQTTPGLDVYLQETGEFTLTGYGELHLDTALRELRKHRCPSVRVGLSPPFVSFSETVADDEGLLALTGVKKTRIGCTGGVLNKAFAQNIGRGSIACLFPDAEHEKVKLWSTLRSNYGFDPLESMRLISLGPDQTKGTCVLFDDTLEDEKLEPHLELSNRQLNLIIAGFRAATATGPLTGDPVRGVALKLLFADIEDGARDATVVSFSRNAVKLALLGARPRLLEPFLFMDVLCPSDSVPQLTDILTQRRGALLSEQPIQATTLLRAKALVPAIDSFGLETQLRMMTHGEAFPTFSFNSWEVVPGDPYDASVRLGPLEPARGFQMARDFVLKTRFRKGLSPDLLSELEAHKYGNNNMSITQIIQIFKEPLF